MSFTSAEVAAAEWSRSQKKTLVDRNSNERDFRYEGRYARYQGENARSGIYQARDRSRSRGRDIRGGGRSRDRSKDRSRGRSRDGSRDRSRGRSKASERDRSYPHNRSKIESAENIKDDAVDEFGRIIRKEARSKMLFSAETDSKNSRIRGRSCSPGERNDRWAHNARNKDEKWSHDKFSYDSEEVPSVNETRKKLITEERYRPPSPEWISRAGGVAIIRKKHGSDK